LMMIEAAEREGVLKPGATIVEATAGNTGTGLALAAAVKGYRLIVVLPDKMSEDKIALLKAYGAEVVITATSVAPDSPDSYNGVADRLSREIPNAWRPNQFDNPNNPEAHYESTGPEIWRDTGGAVEILVAGMGTGGTISGTARYLKERNPGITVIGADPEGSILSGDSPRSYKVEGIGEDFVPRTFDRQVVDEMIRVSDKEAFLTARRLACEEGLLVGGSSGTAVAAGLKYARRLAAPRVMVVLLPDTGRNYISKIFSERWMRENGFWDKPREREQTVREILETKAEAPRLIAAKPNDKLAAVIEVMQHHGISQLPVIADCRAIGSISESTIMKVLHDGIDAANQEVSAVMGKPLPELEARGPVSEAYRILRGGSSGIVVTDNGCCIGRISRTDIVAFLVRNEGSGKQGA